MMTSYDYFDFEEFQNKNFCLDEQSPVSVQPTNTPKSINVLIQNAHTNDRELIPNFSCPFNEKGDLELNQLYSNLKDNGFVPEKAIVFYFNNENGLFIYIGKDPMLSYTSVPQNQLILTNGIPTIHLRLRFEKGQLKAREEVSTVCSPTKESLEMQKSDSDYDPCSDLRGSDKDSTEDESGIPAKRTRHRERTIGEALDLVIRWRDHYHGMSDPLTGLFIKKSLNEAAKAVGVPKKSLDDYMLVINCARKLGYDFLSNKKERFGVLRAFVKNAKKGTCLTTEDSSEDEKLSVNVSKNSKKIVKGF